MGNSVNAIERASTVLAERQLIEDGISAATGKRDEASTRISGLRAELYESEDQLTYFKAQLDNLRTEREKSYQEINKPLLVLQARQDLGPAWENAQGVL